jgi:hypothetical protein
MKNKIKDKYNGRLITTYQDFEIYVVDQPSKTGKGKHRISFNIRQVFGDWDMAFCLGWTKCADIGFEK